MAAIGVLFTCIEIVLQSQQDLRPSMYLGSSIIKMLLLIISIVMDAYATTQPWYRQEINRFFVFGGIGVSSILL
jgi:hypothetical protein